MLISLFLDILVAVVKPKVSLLISYSVPYVGCCCCKDVVTSTRWSESSTSHCTRFVLCFMAGISHLLVHTRTSSTIYVLVAKRSCAWQLQDLGSEEEEEFAQELLAWLCRFAEETPGIVRFVVVKKWVVLA